ncbi:MAG: hypothetical protein K2P94_13370 [Rhodospirillaceae bacterium]|nr:hypothetical protein [Rhodospirillaceae bacterium]
MSQHPALRAPAVGRTRVPPEIKLELFSRQNGFLPKITQIVSSKGPSEGDPAVWLKNIESYLAGGEAMIVNARMGRTLVGFVVLDSSNLAAPFSWVDERFRNKGLGERFYSFACINLGMPAPEFRFHQEMFEEYGYVLKATGAQAKLRNSFYVVNEKEKDAA